MILSKKKSFSHLSEKDFCMYIQDLFSPDSDKNINNNNCNNYVSTNDLVLHNNVHLWTKKKSPY
jgi:hypothetical protein